MKKCILGLKAVCDECGACYEDRCELDPNKLCDNCFKCLEITEARGWSRRWTSLWIRGI